jgi:predicted nucleotidyltransferase
MTVDATDTLDLSRPELDALCRRFHVLRLDVFGSAATGHFDAARSDLDFLVSFAPLRPSQYADAYFGFREELGRLFGREIDLVTEHSLVNPYFRAQIESERQNLFAR